MTEHITWGVLDRRNTRLDDNGTVRIRPSFARSRIPVRRAYTHAQSAMAAWRELSLDLILLRFAWSFHDGALFAVGFGSGCGHRTVGVFDDFDAALAVASDRNVFTASQGTIDLVQSAPVFSTADGFRRAGRNGVPLLDWQGLNAEFFVLCAGGQVDPADCALPTTARTVPLRQSLALCGR